MAVKDREDAIAALGRSEAALREASSDLEQVRAALQESDAEGLTVSELSERFRISENALVEFARTVGELLGERPLSVEAARRAGMLAASAQAWENELGPLLDSAQVRELLGDVSRQRVDELLRTHRLIGLREQSGRRRFPVFQFHDGRPQAPLIDAFWTVAEAAANDWTAASWCVAADDALDGLSPQRWAREGRDPDQLARVARQDAARLAQ
jgi:hypothetical protein